MGMGMDVSVCIINHIQRCEAVESCVCLCLCVGVVMVFGHTRWHAYLPGMVCEGLVLCIDTGTWREMTDGHDELKWLLPPGGDSENGG